MNEVKRKYAWIDLLKPEIQAAVGTLLVLEPAQMGKINRLLPIIGEKRRGDNEVRQTSLGRRIRVAGGRRVTARLPSINGLVRAVVESLKWQRRRRQSELQMTCCSSAERNFEYARQSARMRPDTTLGTGQVIWDRLTGWITGVGQDEALRRALKDWTAKGTRLFEIDDRDDTYKEITNRSGPSVDFIVTGHTHLERAIDMGGRTLLFQLRHVDPAASSD